MTLAKAKRAARRQGLSMIYRSSARWWHRGVLTLFDSEDEAATDWEVYVPEMCPAKETAQSH